MCCACAPTPGAVVIELPCASRGGADCPPVPWQLSHGWVEVTSTQPCDSCHGTGGQSAPPRDAHGNSMTTAPGVGAHAQHMTASSPWHAPLACNECHQVPGSTTDQTHLDSINEVYLDPTTMVPGSTTGTGGQLQIPGAAYSAAAFTCSGTYCPVSYTHLR